jgi:hypothetical protein
LTYWNATYTLQIIKAFNISFSRKINLKDEAVMGIWKSFLTGLPTLNFSEFEAPLSAEKKDILLHYSLYILTDGFAFKDGAQPSTYEIRRSLGLRGLDPDDIGMLRSFIIRNGLMSAWR